MTPVSHSELACFRRCPQEWTFRYVMKRAPMVDAMPLRVGKNVHAALGKFHRRELHDSDIVKFGPTERAMIRAYAKRWAPERSSLAVEKTDVFFCLPISVSVAITGELDAIATDTETNRKVVLEHKTTSEDIAPGSNYWRRVVHADVQVSMYLSAAASLGLDSTFLMWDVIRKPALRLCKNETEDELEGRCIAAMAERPDYYLRRASVVRFEEEHLAHVRDIHGTVHLMQTVNTMNDPPRNRDACFMYGRECDFFGVCNGELSIDDETRFKPNDHVLERDKKVAKVLGS